MTTTKKEPTAGEADVEVGRTKAVASFATVQIFETAVTEPRDVTVQVVPGAVQERVAKVQFVRMAERAEVRGKARS